MNKKEAERLLSLTDSYQRMPLLFEIKKFLWPPTWLKLLGENWTLCDNVCRYTDRILFEKPVANIDGPVRQMMTSEEWEELGKMPNQIPIFRGCYEGSNEDGISYSLDAQMAKRFVDHNRYQGAGAQPILRHGLVNKSTIIAYKNDRNEREIIIRHCEIIHDEPLFH